MIWNQFFKKVRIGKSGWVTLSVFALIVVGFVCFQTSGASSQAIQTALPCSLATLNGSYNTTRSGFLPGNEFFPFVQIGRVTFDGAGNFEGFFFFKNPLGPIGRGPLKGTYKVHPNCTGSLTSDTTFAYLVIAHDGEEFYQIPTGKGPLGPGVVSIGTGKKQ